MLMNDNDTKTSKYFSVMLPNKMSEKLTEIAAKKFVTKSGLVRRFIYEGLQREEKKLRSKPVLPQLDLYKEKDTAVDANAQPTEN